MFTVDYLQQDTFSVEMSFTALDWMIMKRIIDDRTYDFTNITALQRMQLCFNMFPGANGIFHLLAPHQKVCNIEIIASIFEQARNKWTIPIFRNSKGDTPMDACLDPEIETKNLNLAGLLFEKTMDYPTLHSSHTMNRAICTALSNRIPSVIPYISARMVRSK